MKLKRTHGPCIVPALSPKVISPGDVVEIPPHLQPSFYEAAGWEAVEIPAALPAGEED